MNKVKQKNFKVIEKTVHRCFICGETNYTLSKHWPGSRYCAKCGLKMDIPNYEVSNELWSAVAKINYVISSMELSGIDCLFDLYPEDKKNYQGHTDKLLHNIDKLLVNVFNAYHKFTGGDDIIIKGSYHTRSKRSREWANKNRKKIVNLKDYKCLR